jgi:uncharacterized membrane protein YhaH (DUF805 family)
MAFETVSPLQTFTLQLRRYADFTGRSMRTELALFYVATMIANLLVAFAAMTVSVDASRIASALVGMLLACPWAALAVRRLHDSGRSGWWLLLALPSVGLNVWDDWVRFQDPFAMPMRTILPGVIQVAVALPTLGLFVLLLSTDDPDTNRFGPNPRFSNAGEPA